MAKWGTLSVAATIPDNTTLKFQILDGNNIAFSDAVLPGNSVGIASTSIDLSNVPVLTCATSSCSSKPYKVKIRYIMSTGDTGITPTVNSVSLTWTKTQGDLSATTAANTPWFSAHGNQQGTLHSQYALSGVYPAFKWVSDRYTGNYNMENYFIYDGKLLGYRGGQVSGDYVNYSFIRNKDTGQEITTIPDSYFGEYATVGQNGTVYATDISYDAFQSIDVLTGFLKWNYNWGGGHGNGNTSIGPDGTIYTIRQNNLVNYVSKTSTLFAFNPDGTIKYQQDFVDADYVYPTHQTLSLDGSVLYFGVVTTDEDGEFGLFLNTGRLYAINTSDGSLKWSYVTGDISYPYSMPIVDTDGTIYVASQFLDNGPLNPYPLSSSEKKLFAINPDGSLKWSTSVTNSGTGVKTLSLRNDGILMVLREDVGDLRWLIRYNLQAIDTANGDIIWEIPIGSIADMYFTDNSNGTLLKDEDLSSDFSSQIMHLRYYDKDGNFKWKMTQTRVVEDGTYDNVYDYAYSSLLDERGYIYSGLKKSAHLSVSPYTSNESLTYAQSFALSPWTLTQSSTIQSNLYPGDNMTFTVTTSMGTTNPLFGGDNQVQVYLDTGTVFPLSYSHTDSNGNTVWRSTYYLPDNTPLGTHTYTVEASQAHLQTDITTHFSSPPTESLNTGITATPQSFNVVQRNQQPSPDSNDHTCRDSKPLTTPDLFQINTNGNSAKLFFSPVPSMNHYYLSFSTKSNAEDYGADVTLAPEGVQNYTITQLKPNTTYYFKVRAQNGCTSGDWSNIFKVTTKGRGVTKTTAYFKKNQPKTNSAASTIIKKTTNYTKKLTNSTPQFINPPKDTLINPQSNPSPVDTTPSTQNNTPVTQSTSTPTPKKFCILWWCM